MNLVRVSKSKGKGPFEPQTYYKWFHLGKHLEIFVKFGGSLFVDTDKLAELLEAGRGK